MNPNPLRRYFRYGLLPQLMAFEACVRHGSVTRAAEELALAQPTVSGLVRKLSETMGAPMTAQRDRRIVATPQGEQVLLLCSEILAAFHRFAAARPDWEPGPAPRYHRPHTDPAGSEPCPSDSPSDPPSRSKPRAWPSPHPKPKPFATDGA
jgi:hypothetical protein